MTEQLSITTPDKLHITASRSSQYTNTAERRLLTIAAVFIGINFASLAIQRDIDPSYWLQFLIWAGCGLISHVIMVRYLPQRDPLILPVVMLLSGWGLVIISRLIPEFAQRQALWLIFATFAMLASAISPYAIRWLRSYRYVLLFAGILLLIATIALGSNPSGFGPELWIGIAGVYLQPSEPLKVILIAFLASYLAEQFPRHHAASLQLVGLSVRALGPTLLMWGLSVVVLIWQRDLGTAVIFFVVYLFLLYAATGQRLIVAGGLLLLIVASIAAYLLFTVVELRIDVWVNPWPEADGRAYQIVQSLMAFAHGGVLGQGINQGFPQYIPVVHSDFVFAALAEEWGLLGVILIIACFAVLVVRGFGITITNQIRPFHALLALGLSLLIGIQSLLIMGGVLKVLPLTGVTLPFVSYGGSSLLTSFVIVGLLLRLSTGMREQ